MGWWKQGQSGKSEIGVMGVHSRRSYGDKEEDLVDIKAGQERSVEESQGNCGRNCVLDVPIQASVVCNEMRKQSRKGVFIHKRIVVAHGFEQLLETRLSQSHSTQ